MNPAATAPGNDTNVQYERWDMNQPQFCYVLTTTGRDRFADMTYASAAFLRHAYPESKISCLCDAPSHRALEETRHPLLELVDRAGSGRDPRWPARLP